MNSQNTTPKEDALLPINHHSISLPSFHGPLDLLLFLIRKNEIDIYDIPIEEVTKQYLEMLNNLKEIDLELTGDFFVLAATLMLIKSRMLVPKHDTDPPEDPELNEQDPRWELVQQLIEYKRLKEQANELGSLISLSNEILPRLVLETPSCAKTRTLKHSDRIELWHSFNKVLQQLSKKIIVGQIDEDPISVSQQMNFILQTITLRPQFLFSSLFDEQTMTINTLLATFLAILELTRLNKLHLEQAENFGDILCTAKEFRF